MKFSEIIEPAGGFINSTSSYFLVLGIEEEPTSVPVPNPITSSSVENIYNSGSGLLFDPNGNNIAWMKNVSVQIYASQSEMTVWNGTSMESEPLSLYLPMVRYFERHEILIPPGYRFQYFGIAIGFWLSESEVQEMIMHGSLNMSNIQNWGENQL